MSYHKFKSENLDEYGSFEVFHSPEAYELGTDYEAGWYWWACFPGCMPDGDPMGPFESEEAAIENAREEEY